MKAAGGGYNLSSASYCQQFLLFSARGVTAQHTKGERNQAEMKCMFHSILADVELIETILTKIS